MRSDWGPPSLILPLLLLAALTLPGDGNEGSSTGICRCDVWFNHNSPPKAWQMKHLRKHVKRSDLCPSSVRRFHLPQVTVCGSSGDPWVTELINCFNRRECGHVYPGRVGHQQHLPLESSQVPKSTERAPAIVGTSAQTYLPPTSQSTQQPTLPAGALSLDKNLTHASEASTSSVGHSLEAGPEAGENEKQLEENEGPTVATPVIVPVLSLLATCFILTGILLCVLCKRRDLHL